MSDGDGAKQKKVRRGIWNARRFTARSFKYGGQERLRR